MKTEINQGAKACPYFDNKKEKSQGEVMKGKIIAFEGGEGSGKTTAIKEVYNHLKELGVNIELYREPGGMAASEDIREVILKHDLDPMTEAMLFAAARSELFRKEIGPLLEKGVHILLDRCVMSSLCYQGYCGIGVNLANEINEFAIGDYYPDLVLYFDVEPTIGLKRVHSGDREVNRIDRKPIVYHEKVRSGYKYLSEMFKNSFLTIDASKPQDQVILDAFDIVKRFLKAK